MFSTASGTTGTKTDTTGTTTGKTTGTGTSTGTTGTTTGTTGTGASEKKYRLEPQKCGCEKHGVRYCSKDNDKNSKCYLCPKSCDDIKLKDRGDKGSKKFTKQQEADDKKSCKTWCEGKKENVVNFDTCADVDINARFISWPQGCYSYEYNSTMKCGDKDEKKSSHKEAQTNTFGISGNFMVNPWQSKTYCCACNAGVKKADASGQCLDTADVCQVYKDFNNPFKYECNVYDSRCCSCGGGIKWPGEGVLFGSVAGAYVFVCVLCVIILKYCTCCAQKSDTTEDVEMPAKKQKEKTKAEKEEEEENTKAEEEEEEEENTNAEEEDEDGFGVLA